MKSTDTSASPVYTVFKAIKGTKGTIILKDAFADESAAMQYAWTCVNLLNMSWAEVHAPNGERISLHVAA